MLVDYLFYIIASAVIIYTIFALVSFVVSYFFDIKENKYVCLIVSLLYLVVVFFLVYGWRLEFTKILDLPIIAVDSDYYEMAFLGVSIAVAISAAYVFYSKIRKSS
ncbi:Uncharacterised protein [Klebsiella pneumoniae]|nr:Uncharacterised protein [Klebsiella pneumoniae]